MSRILHGDAFDALANMDPESVHAVVTDPPYGLAFMGRDWDDFEPKEYQEWCEEWATLALDVLKPGGHLLAFSGNRTHHRLFSGVEDAGFEVRDTLTWHYGSGFPKALDVSKALDKQAGAEREVLSTEYKSGGDRVTMNVTGNNGRVSEGASLEGEVKRTAPATEAAREWDGWKTALKPATEFVVLARKPFEGTVAENVVEHGTAALNIDGCRIEVIGSEELSMGSDFGDSNSLAGNSKSDRIRSNYSSAEKGRYPANVIFDGAAAEELDRQVGELSSGELTPESANEVESTPAANCYGEYAGRSLESTYESNSGGPSRYFYTSKASRSERTLGGRIDNAHPTVKPVDLMEWLVKLVTAEGQTVLDPFAGTGTTCRAAKNLGREFVGIEKQAKWADVARARCGLDVDDPDLLTPEEQATLADGGFVEVADPGSGGDE